MNFPHPSRRKPILRVGGSTTTPIDKPRFATRRISRWLAIGLITALGACSADAATTSSTTASSKAAATASTAASNSDASTSSTAAASEAAANASASNPLDDHYSKEDAAFDDADAVAIELKGSTASAASNAVKVDGSTVTIAAAGVYRLSGELDGSVIVDSAGEGMVRLILDDVTITNDAGAAINVVQSDETTVVLADGSTSKLSGKTADADSATDDESPTAALFSQDDLTIDGGGSLEVEGSNDGIGSKDGLVIAGGTITVNAGDDAIRGKDYVLVDGADITATAGDHGLVSDNETTTTATTEDAESEQPANVTVRTGTVTIEAASDGIHSNGLAYVEGGEVTLTVQDDGIHADTAVTIANGTLDIPESYEGIEGAAITIAGGTVDVNSSDDGINISGGVDGSGTAGPGAGRGGPGNLQTPTTTATTTDDTFDSAATTGLTVSGGVITVNADGDGLDANGSVTITGGEITVFGPTANNNGALDVDGSFTVTNATLLAVGSSGMAMAPTASGQAVLNVSANAAAGDKIIITAEDGTSLADVTTPKQAQSIIFTSPEVEASASYGISIGGEDLGSVTGQG